MREIIIFCGPPADGQYTLDIYEKNKDRAKISIFIISNKKNYNFIKSLGLNLEKLVLITSSEGFTKKNPYKILKEKIFSEKTYFKYFKHLVGNEVYFFNHYASWKTFTFVSRLAKNNTCIFWDHFDSSLKGILQERVDLRRKLLQKIYEFLANTKFRWAKLDKFVALEFPYEEYNIKKIEAEQPSKDLYERYSYKCASVKKRSVLLFESAENYEVDYVNYSITMEKIANSLKNEGFDIYLKPHPQVGCSSFLEKYATEIIPDYIPGEFINLDDFIGILGIVTLTIAKIAKNAGKETISLINLFNFKEESRKDYFTNYLIDQSKGKIKFVKSIDELIHTLDSSLLVKI